VPGEGFRWYGGGGKRLGERIAQVAWVTAHTRDLMADFRAIYHLPWEEALSLPGPEFFALALRLPAYNGVMALRVEKEEHNANRNVMPGARMVESEKEAIDRDPLLRGVIEFG